MSEKVLVIPESNIEVLGNRTGFIPMDEHSLELIAGSSALFFMDRELAENDPRYKQLIPYVVIAFYDGEYMWVFRYTRSKGQGEQRLHGKVSVGISGHVNPIDKVTEGCDLIVAAARREMSEEVRLFAHSDFKAFGFIYDPSNEVGLVHLGIAFLQVMDTPAVLPNEPTMLDTGFVRIGDIDMDSLENWSKLCVQELRRIQARDKMLKHLQANPSILDGVIEQLSAP